MGMVFGGQFQHLVFGQAQVRRRFTNGRVFCDDLKLGIEYGIPRCGLHADVVQDLNHGFGGHLRLVIQELGKHVGAVFKSVFDALQECGAGVNQISCKEKKEEKDTQTINKPKLFRGDRKPIHGAMF
jgi:hypothetical protein